MDSSDIQIPGYTIHTAIGHGGMATVYLATQESLNRKVAIKVLHNRNEAAISERFINEARYIASLDSPHIITIYDISSLESGDCYIAMEFIAGGDLAENASRMTSAHSMLHVVRQMAQALEVVHDSGIIHRDVKPTNILFRKDGTAVLTDFGIAKDVDNAADLTQAGFSLGSPSYSSPEQAQCLPIDLTTDIYSLGVVLVELLLGYNPFRADSHTSTSLNHIQLPVPRLPAELDYLSPLVNKMLAKHPGERYQSARELIVDIDRALTTADGVHRRAPAPRFPADSLRRRRLLRLHLPRLPHLSLANIRSWMSGLRAGFRLHLPALATLSAQKSAHKLRHTLAAVAGSALMAVFYFGAFHQSETEREIDRLLGKAEQSMQAGRYMAPATDNARDLYRQVLHLDNTNLNAIWGLKTAEQKQVEVYLAQAARALEHGRLQRPERESAYHYFRQVLAIDPKNARARSGIMEVVQEYIRLARTEMSENNYSDANYYVDSGLNIAPNNAVLLSLGDEVKKRQQRAMSQQRERRQQLTPALKQKSPTLRTHLRSALDKLRDTISGDH